MVILQCLRDELVRRDYAATTIRSYVQIVDAFRQHTGARLDRITPAQLRRYHLFLLEQRRLAIGTVVTQICALRFFCRYVLHRRDAREDLPYPKERLRLPVVLSPDEVQRLIASAKNLYHRTLLLTLYGAGLRRSEVCHLKVGDIDSQRMVLRVNQGKAGRDRDIPLSPRLLAALREDDRWMRPQTYLFPGTRHGWRADAPITSKGDLGRRAPGHTQGRHRQARHSSHAGARQQRAARGAEPRRETHGHVPRHRRRGQGRAPTAPMGERAAAEANGGQQQGQPGRLVLPLGNQRFNVHTFPRKVIQSAGVVLLLYETHQGIRQIFTDGRHSEKEEPQPWFYGYSVGHWEGDTLVVETSGFRDGEWLDINGSALTEQGRMIERFRRRISGRSLSLKIEQTIDDPRAYTRPFTTRLTWRLMPDTEIMEMICLENNQSIHHLVAF